MVKLTHRQTGKERERQTDTDMYVCSQRSDYDISQEANR